ncbi:MAG TPA: SDR family oxidoreductase [Acidimicrobiales bacterium]|nr:SDR family oxidoreductase [Acidimicrobiales bacterium]
MPAAHSLEGRVAIVTGGGTGIGRATALVLAEHGADLVLAGRRTAPLEETAAVIDALGRRAVTVPTDVTDPDQCQGLVATTLAALGRVDILVNNAGGGKEKDLLDWTPEEWRDVIALNLESVWYMSRFAAEPMLQRRKGSIVNISSGATMLTLPKIAPYGAAKAGVNNLTGALAAGLTPHGIRVNAIAVGAVHTDQTIEENLQYVGEAKVFPGNALGRLGRPEEIGYAVHFFASDASSFCSGQTIWINGGRRG